MDGTDMKILYTFRLLHYKAYPHFNLGFYCYWVVQMGSVMG